MVWQAADRYAALAKQVKQNGVWRVWNVWNPSNGDCLMLKLSVIGNLGNDPEMKYAASGSPILRFNVAANFRVRNESGEWVDKTEWVRVTVFGQRAESLSNLLKKGQRVYADGRLEARPWTTQHGEVRAGLEMIADTVEFASSRRDDDDQPVRASVTDERRQPKGNDDDSDLPF